MLDTLTHNEWCSFIGSILKKYVHVCRQDVLIEQDDLEQEAWAALLLAAKNYQKEKARGKFTSYAWIYIHHNVRHFAFSKAQRARQFINDVDLFPEIKDPAGVGEFCIDPEDPHDYFQATDTDDAFKRVIDELSCEDMELIDQRFIQEMTFPDMGKIAGVTPQAMQARVSRVIDKLRMRLSH
jgi:RNA polymerase sigma factor (sigma-70 family)